MKRIHLLGEEARKAIIQLIEIVFGHIVEGAMYLLTNEEGRAQLLVFISSLIALVFVVVLFKELIGLVFYYLVRAISMPRLVREWGGATYYGETKLRPRLSSVALPKERRQRINMICSKVKKGRVRRAPLPNVLIHGATGTGKSTIARAIAIECGLPFAIMSGADIAPLGQLGPTELNNVLLWAQRQKNGGLVIVDEAESALGRRIRRRGKLDNVVGLAQEASSSARDALNVFLSMTGDANGKIMIVLTTSNPFELDDAVLDRCDEIITCDLPTARERKAILTSAFKKAFSEKRHEVNVMQNKRRNGEMKGKQPLLFHETFNVEEKLSELAKDERTAGYTCRELTKIIHALEYEMHFRNETLNNQIWTKEVTQICDMMKKKKHLNILQ